MDLMNNLLKIWPNISNSQYMNHVSFALAVQPQMVINSTDLSVVRTLVASNQKLHEVAQHKRLLTRQTITKKKKSNLVKKTDYYIALSHKDW